MGRLSTHVLDSTTGVPGAGMRIDLYRLDDGAWVLLKSQNANKDGRTDEPLLVGEAFTPGRYKLQFHLGDYFRLRATALPEPPFLDVVPIEIGIADAALHYHVPLLCTPWSYATYRGS